MKKTFLLLSSIFVLSACSESAETEEVAPSTPAAKPGDALTLTEEEESRIGLTISPVIRKSLPVTIEATGTVQANPTQTTPVLSLVPGRVEMVYVQHGEQVKRGQLLARIRSDEVGQLESDLLARLVELKAERKQAQLQLDLAQKNYSRKKFLLEEKIAAKADVEQAETTLEQEKAEMDAIKEKEEGFIRATKERLRLYGISPVDVDHVVEDGEMRVVFDVVSPRTGIVTEREADNNELVPAAKSLFAVSDLSNVWLVANVLESNLRFVKKGLPVEVTVDCFPGEIFKGKLDFLDSHIDSATRSLPVRATIDNRSFRLKPEMFARLKLQVGVDTALVVPEEAVQKVGESSLVYVETGNNKFEERKVKVGQNLDGYTEIVSGISPHERVVVKGSLQLLGQSLHRLSQ